MCVCVCVYMGFPGGSNGEEPSCQCRRCKRLEFDTWVGKSPWRRAWQSTPVSCLENLMDRGAWWATAHAVAKSRAWMEWLGVACVYIYIYIYVYIYLPVQNSSLQRITETKALLSLHSPEEQFWRRPGLGLGSPDFWTTVSELGPQMAQGFWVTFGHTPNKNRPSAMGNKIILNLWLWKLELKPSSCPLLAVVS